MDKPVNTRHITYKAIEEFQLTNMQSNKAAQRWSLGLILGTILLYLCLGKSTPGQKTNKQNWTIILNL